MFMLRFLKLIFSYWYTSLCRVLFIWRSKGQTYVSN